MRISAIVPVLNEEATLPAFLAMCARWDAIDEVLFSDGGSDDATLELLEGRAVIVGAQGRGAQCRLAAEQAYGDALVFVHADTLVAPDAMRAIRNALEDGATWGCLTLRFSGGSSAMAFGAFASNARVRLTGIPFGDQVMFMTRDAYERVGGMPDLPLMEDYELARRLRALAWPRQLRSQALTSARRFEEGGTLRTMAQMRRLRHLYRKGADIDELARLYRTQRELRA